MKLNGRQVFQGIVEGEVLLSSMGISFFGGVDPDTGIVVEKDHDLQGQCISGKILAFPKGKGSTVGSYTIYRLKKSGKAPLAMINAECETITAVGCIISEIPCIDQIDLHQLSNGQKLLVNANDEFVEVIS